MQFIKRLFYFFVGILLLIPLTFFGALNFLTARLVFNDITSFFYDNCLYFLFEAWSPNNQAGSEDQNDASEHVTSAESEYGEDEEQNYMYLNKSLQEDTNPQRTKKPPYDDDRKEEYRPTKLSGEHSSLTLFAQPNVTLKRPQSSAKIVFELDKIIPRAPNMLCQLTLMINDKEACNAIIIRIQRYTSSDEARSSMEKLCKILSESTIKSTNINIDQFPNDSRSLADTHMTMITSSSREIRLPICSKGSFLTKDEIESTLQPISLNEIRL